MDKKYTSVQVTSLIQRIVFACHAERKKQDEGTDDLENTLSFDGIDQAMHLAKLFARLGFTFDVSFTSPAWYVRETQGFSLCYQDPELVVLDELYPEYDPNNKALEVILDAIANRQEKGPENCIVFGHQPMISRLIRELIVAGTVTGSNEDQLRYLDSLELGEGQAVSLRLVQTPEYKGYYFEDMEQDKERLAT